MAAASVVEQAAEDRIVVESGQAQPGDAPIEAHQRRRLAVPDQTEILEAVVAVGPGDRAERRVKVEHAGLASSGTLQ
jgi:hypothetical protein